MKVINGQEIIKFIDQRRCIIYGTGFTAETLCKALQERCMMIRSCAVSGQLEEDYFHGIRVYSINDMPKELLEGAVILAAVHESNIEDVERNLLSRGINDAVWIYPVLHEIVFGCADNEISYIPVEDIVNAICADTNWLEIRYCAVKNYFEKSDSCNQLYIKGMGLFSMDETVRLRQKRVHELIISMQSRGFMEEYPILLDEKLRMIDGLHRLAAALWLGIAIIPCRIMKTQDFYEDIIPDNVRLTSDAAARYLTGKEIMLLNQMKEEIKDKAYHLTPEVSLIIPVYNVEQYIDQCLKSAVSQSFKNMEIILINDGSTDGSGSRCLSWAKKDKRIRYYEQENKGVSAARNFGIELSRGTYIGFADPDDWLEPDYIESLYAAITESDADISECDIFRYNEKNGKEVYRAVYGKMGIPYSEEEHMKYAPTASYKSLYRKSLWMDNNIRFPDCSFESPAVYALLRALSHKNMSIQRPLYHYRVGRDNSLIENGYAAKDGTANNTLGCEAMEFIIREFKRTKVYEQYNDVLNSLIKYRLSDILATQFTRKNQSDYRKTAENFRTCLADLFPEEKQEQYITWGGYNLNREMVYLPMLHDPYGRFNFSSMISLLGDAGEFAVKHKNRYRQIMLQREFSGSFGNILQEIQPEYVFADLIEERFDIIDYNGSYLTLSDAFEGIEEQLKKHILDNARIISRTSDECFVLWKQAFGRFVNMIGGEVPDCRIIIIENYLSTERGDAFSREPFDNIDIILQINEILKTYYDHIRSTYPYIRIVPAYTCDMYFTDKDYEYGSIPSHLNEVVNKEVALLTQAIINDD